MEIRFVRPFARIAHAEMTTEPLPDNQTKVSWSTSSKIKYPLNIGISLTALKNILEKQS